MDLRVYPGYRIIKPKQITALRKKLEEGTVNQGFMISIFNSCIAVKAPERKVVLSGKKLTKYFPEDYSETDMEKVIRHYWNNGKDDNKGCQNKTTRRREIQKFKKRTSMREREGRKNTWTKK